MLSRVFKRLTGTFKRKGPSKGCHQAPPRRFYPSANRGAAKRIMVFGESNAFRTDGNNKCWPALLENKDPHHLNVFNESCDGRTTSYDIGEKNGLGVIANKLKGHLPLDYVIIMLGINDLKNKYGPPSPLDIADGMRQILDFIDIYGGGAKPILLTPPPMGNVTSGELVGGHLRIPPVVDEFRLLALNRDILLIDIHAILDVSIDLESDMIHLNAVGRQNVANAVWASVKDMTPLPPG